MQEIECEFHFLLQCPFYDRLRANFSSIVFDKTLFNFKSIMSCSDNNHLTALAFFIWKCFTLREDYCIVTYVVTLDTRYKIFIVMKFYNFCDKWKTIYKKSYRHMNIWYHFTVFRTTFTNVYSGCIIFKVFHWGREFM